MNSIERVKAALTFSNPDKVPVFNLIMGDVFPLPITHSKNWQPGWNEGEEGLFPHVPPGFKWKRPDWAKKDPNYEGENWRKIPHEEIDEWGCIWNMKGLDKDMGHPGRPSLLDWKDFDDYIEKYTPNPYDKSRYASAIKLKQNLKEKKYLMVLINGFGPSQTVAAMRGFNTYLLDHKRHPEELKKALEHVAKYHVDVLKNCFKLGVNPHGIWLVDDLGEQANPFFSPRTFKNIYEGAYRMIIDGAHDLGMEVHHHCCGKVDPLLPILIDWGLDAIEFDSPRMNGYEDLKPYRGKIMFWGCVNIQSIYPNGTPEEVEREVWHMIRNLGTRHGGFGAYFYPQSRTIRVPRKNIKAFERGLEKYGVYSQIPEHWWDYPVETKWDYHTVPPLPPL